MGEQEEMDLLPICLLIFVIVSSRGEIRSQVPSCGLIHVHCSGLCGSLKVVSVMMGDIYRKASQTIAAFAAVVSEGGMLVTDYTNINSNTFKLSKWLGPLGEDHQCYRDLQNQIAQG
jgi:hypothetical protein